MLRFQLPFIFLYCLFTTIDAWAQKGSPPKEVVTATVVTNFPQHELFNESMVSRIKVASGFAVTIAATGLGKPRMMAFSDKGHLYVTRRDQGDVLQLVDSDKDGRFDQMHTVISKFPSVHGIAFREGYLYVISNRELKRAKLNDDGSAGEPDLLIKDLPDGGQHPNRTLAIGPDGMLYISVGSTCNACNETRDEAATLLIADPQGKSRRIFASGLRNTIGFDWHPQTGQLWGLDHRIDNLGDNEQPEEINLLEDGKTYGWPYIYADGKFHEMSFYPARLDGRSGRGDTCIGAYVARRLSMAPREAGTWAAAITSLKMENPGPFNRSIGEVEDLIRAKYSNPSTR